MKRLFTYSCAVLIIGIGLWLALFPDKYDTKNLHYVAWKYHLLPMDGNRAASLVAIDSDRDKIVLGKTKSELEQRFVFVRTVDQVNPYLRDYCAASRPGAEVLSSTQIT